MPLLTFAPTVGPSVGSGSTLAPRVLRAEFGDGYNQRIGDGINTVPENWSLRWGPLNVTQMTEIWTFLKARAGAEAFLWTPPGLTQARYVCPASDRSTIDGLLWSISAEFEQVFDHG
jgi:phage-related protein